MKKRQAVEYSIEEMDAQQRKEEQLREKDELRIKKEKARPFLLKRIGAGFVDIVFSLILAAGAFVFTYFVVFPHTGYDDAARYVVEAYYESNLFVQGLSGYEEITGHYDENKTPEENYDVPITMFYTTNERAIQDKKYDEYLLAKLSSNLYVIDEDGKCVRKESVSYLTAKTFLEAEYSKAVSYFDDNQELQHANYVMAMSMSVALLAVSTFGSAVFFMLVPLIDRRNRTFGYMMFKLIPTDSKLMTPIDKKRNLFRNFIFVSITFISPFTLNLLLNTLTFSFIPFFVNSAILCFSRFNTGLHDLATNVTVLNASYSNSFEILEAIKEQGGNNQ